MGVEVEFTTREVRGAFCILTGVIGAYHTCQGVISHVFIMGVRSIYLPLQTYGTAFGGMAMGGTLMAHSHSQERIPPKRKAYMRARAQAQTYTTHTHTQVWDL